MPVGLPERITIKATAGPDQVHYVGPSFKGLVYRSSQQGAYYRLLPGEAPIRVVDEARTWVAAPPRPGIAAVSEVNLAFEDECSFVYIRYVASGAETLQEALRSQPAIERLHKIAKALRSLNQWWNFTGSGLLPMPADIVLGPADMPLLLAAPFHSDFVGVDALLEEPVRVRYLSPERLRCNTNSPGDADDLFVFIAMTLLAINELTDLSPGEAILRGANRSLYGSGRLTSSLPPWMDRVESVREMRAEILRLISVGSNERMRIDPHLLASQLDDWARRSEAYQAISHLRSLDRADEARKLLREILEYDESYELLLLAATIAKTPLEAIEYLERAIGLAKDLREAYSLQLGLITGHDDLWLSPETDASDAPDGFGWRGQLHTILWRDFNSLSSQEQAERTREVCQSLIRRKDFRGAAEFIYPRLFDREGRYIWWNFDLVLDYGEALMGQGSLEAAESTFNGTTTGLAKVSENRTESSENIYRYAARLAVLKERFAKRKSEMQHQVRSI